MSRLFLTAKSHCQHQLRVGWFPLHLWASKPALKLTLGQPLGWLRSWRTLQFLWARISTYVSVVRTQSCGHPVLQGRLGNWSLPIFPGEVLWGSGEWLTNFYHVMWKWLAISCQVSARAGFEYSQSCSKSWHLNQSQTFTLQRTWILKADSSNSHWLYRAVEWIIVFGNDIQLLIFLLTLGDLILFFKS